MAGAYDIHIVADELPDRLAIRLLHLGYEHRRVLGGDQRVRMKYLLTQKQPSRRSADSMYGRTILELQQYPSFNGYMEEEATAHDLFLNEKHCIGGAEPFPLKLLLNESPEGSQKKCDIHITATRDPVLVIERLRQVGFYYQRLEKPRVGPVHVMTIQAATLQVGKHIWKDLIPYLTQSSSFIGSAKFEVALRIDNFNFRLPPVVTISE